jgi:hypothetical protein
MNLSEETFLGLLIDVDSLAGKQKFYSFEKSDNGYLDPNEMAHLYTNSALLVTIMGFLKDRLWLDGKKNEKLNKTVSYENFISPYFLDALKPVLFLKEFLVKSGESNIKQVLRNSKVIEAKVLSLIILRSNIDRKVFAIQSLKEMSIHFLKEEKNQKGRSIESGHKGLKLYRTFDNLDTIFKLDYNLDRDMVIDHKAKERLYAGSGIGVQSGYSTILLALDCVDVLEEGRVIDLGSGYGRVGLVCSLLRPDIDFIGYEYVPHRVKVGNEASVSFGLESGLKFITQDLSLESFQIPMADVYYLYDPFTKDTYHYVLEQIVEISKVRRVTIVTKGNARGWFVDIAALNSWKEPELLDDGNLCVFRSA